MEEFGRRCCPPVPFDRADVWFAHTVRRQRRAEGPLSPGHCRRQASGHAGADGAERQLEPSGLACARARNGGFVIDGTKLFVANVHTADTLLVAVRSSDAGDQTLALACCSCQATRLALRRRPYRLSLQTGNLRWSFIMWKSALRLLLGQLHQGWPLIKQTIDYATVAKRADMVGIAQVALIWRWITPKIAQFGRPIGSFQTIKHKCADMVIDVDGSRFITYRAAWCLANGQEAIKEIAMAKAWTS